MLPQPKLDALIARHAAIETELAAQPDRRTYIKLSREFSELSPLVETVKAYRAALDELFARVDFLSVGSNDLFQFLYAIDRSNTRVADRFDPISVPVLRALKVIVDKGHANGKPVALCGEMASTPLGALALVALGFRVLSLTPSAVGPVKAMLLDLDAGKAQAVLKPLLDRTVSSIVVRDRLAAFAAAEGLQL